MFILYVQVFMNVFGKFFRQHSIFVCFGEDVEMAWESAHRDNVVKMRRVHNADHQQHFTTTSHPTMYHYYMAAREYGLEKSSDWTIKMDKVETEGTLETMQWRKK